jgi:hypothetical protein
MIKTIRIVFLLLLHLPVKLPLFTVAFNPVCAQARPAHVNVTTNIASGVKSVSYEWSRGDRLVFSDTEKWFVIGNEMDPMQGFLLETVIDIFCGTNIVYSLSSSTSGATSRFFSNCSSLEITVIDRELGSKPDVIIISDQERKYLIFL